MTVTLRKPILLGGIGISVGLWLTDRLGHSVMEVGQLTVLAAIALGSVLWWRSPKNANNILSPQISSPLTLKTVEEAIATAEATIAKVEEELTDKDISPLKQQLASLPELLNKQDLQLAVTGGKKVGKTSLKQVLEDRGIAEDISFVETEALYTESDAKEVELALASDLVLFVTASDLTDSQWQTLKQLTASHQRILLLFNKQDRYVPEERAIIREQLRQRVQAIIPVEDILAISASPAAIKVRKHQADGSVEEWMEPQEAEVGNLSDRLSTILTQEREQLVWGTTWREAEQLKRKAKKMLNEARGDRALPIIEQYQWVSAAAAFANPVAALDLLAAAAINTQMLVDLSSVYQQKFSLSQAQTAAGTIGKLMVQLGLVELSTQTIGSMLKTHAVTYVAGGAVQGVSAAYLTRIAGLSLIEYWKEQEVSVAEGEGLNLARLTEKLKQVFEQNQRAAFLQGFVKQSLGRLIPC